MDTFLIRNVRPDDLADLHRLSRHIDSSNLPADRAYLKALVEDSQRSFRGELSAAEDGRYLFVLEETGSERVVGCSLLVAKRGRPGLPRLYMTVFVETRTSVTLKKTVEHRCLRLGETEDGPTELGGLVLLPAFRGRKEKLGAWLSYVRLLYVAAHLDRFQTNLMAEYPFQSPKERAVSLWECVGRKFTGIDRKRADRLITGNREFLLSLFPRGTIYQDFFPPETVKSVGRLGKSSVAAAHLLSKAGFRYIQQVEPIGGGPCFGTLTREAGLVRSAKQLQCFTLHTRTAGNAHLVLSEDESGMRAMVAPLRHQGIQASLGVETARRLAIKSGEWFWAAPLP